MTDCSGKKCLPGRPTPDQIHSAILAEWSARIFNGAPVVPGSAEDIVAGTFAGLLYEAHGWVEAALRETDPACMCCDNLIEFGRRRGIYPLPAKAAVGYVKITGVSGTTVPLPLTFSTATGATFITDPTYPVSPLVLDANGEAVIRIVADNTGPAYNLPGGTTLFVNSPPPDVNTDATVVGSGLAGGADEEDCETFRRRVLERLRSGGVSGNAAWIIGQIREWPGVSRVCVSTCDCPVPSYYVFMDGAYPDGIPPVEVLQEIEDYIFGMPQGAGLGIAPVGARGHIKQAQIEPVSITITGLVPSTASVQDAVVNAVMQVFNEAVCPGGCMCLRLIDDAIMSVPEVECYSAASVVPGPHSTINDDELCMDCDWMPRVDGVVFL